MSESKQFLVKVYLTNDIKAKLTENTRRFGFNSIGEYIATTFESLIKLGIDKSLIDDLQSTDVDNPDVPLLDKYAIVNTETKKTDVARHKGLIYPVIYSDKLKTYVPYEIGGTTGQINPKHKNFDKTKIPLLTIRFEDYSEDEFNEIGVGHQTLEIIDEHLEATLQYLKVN